MPDVQLSTLGAVIKTAYEAETDTNAFTDIEKTKLTGIEIGAEVNPTAGEILTALLTVDGAASSLDADLLDAQQGTYYLDYDNFTNTPTIPSSTTQISEGINLYYTDGRADARIAAASINALSDVIITAATTGEVIRYNGTNWVDAALSTTDVSEGTNLYFTDERVDDRVAALLIAGANITLTYDDPGNTLTIAAAGGGGALNDLSDVVITAAASGEVIRYDGTNWVDATLSTTDVSEGTNLYYTDGRADTRADARIAAASINALSDVDTTTAAPADGDVLVWSAADSEWQPESPGGGAPLAVWDYWYEDRFSSRNIGGSSLWLGGVVAGGNNSLGVPGVTIFGYNSHGVGVRSNTTVDGGYRYQSEEISTEYFGQISRKFRCRYTPRTVATTMVRMGWLDTTTHDDATDGVYFEVDGATIRAKTADNSVRETNATTYTMLANTPYVFDIDVNAAGTSARFRVYEALTVAPVLDVSNTTNIPTTSARAAGSGFIATESTASIVDIGVLHSLGVGTIEAFARRYS